MARWRDDEQVPAALARFSLGDWAGADPEAAVAAWSHAAREWIEGHPGKPLPWAAEGGPVDVLCAVVRLRLMADWGVLAGRVLSAGDLTRLVATRWTDVPTVWGRGNGYVQADR